MEPKSHHPIASTSTLSCCPIPPKMSLLLIYPPQLSALVDCCLGWVAQLSRASYLPLAAHRDPIILAGSLSSKTSLLSLLFLALPPPAVLFTVVVVAVVTGVVVFLLSVVDMVAVAMCCCCCCHRHRRLRHHQHRFITLSSYLSCSLAANRRDSTKTSQSCIAHGDRMECFPLDWPY